MENHLDWISSFSGVVALIADIERLQYRREKLLKRESFLCGVNLPTSYKQWSWDLAPNPEIDFCIGFRHIVAGYTNVPKKVWLNRNGKKSAP